MVTFIFGLGRGVRRAQREREKECILRIDFKMIHWRCRHIWLTYAYSSIADLKRLISEEPVHADVAEMTGRVVIAILAHPVTKRRVVDTAVCMVITGTF